MRKEYPNIFGKVFLTVDIDKKNEWVHNDWIGYLTRDNVQFGALAYLNAVRESGFSCVLNDNSKVLGSWDHSLEWTAKEWVPLAAKAGLKYFAMIVSPDSLAESSVLSFANLITSFEVKVFSNITDAKSWLRYHSLGAKV
ncbi:STAS/SEC14 domain-containing protein [Pontibacter diazotrophicus]|uniref:STAS/SEC14 domain-containing protein n=1 Tax=Pontibacter diazotrophicus TaxID=1400979 RepID=A0A3D8L3H9_9BACT|nr:STAS/SEC14 domain-containing protein [Pontibacter diazotrophicus]RDV11968.1 STAS/SEC14 domain-containing protein [Pontibacter diazotrophicus]